MKNNQRKTTREERLKKASDKSASGATAMADYRRHEQALRDRTAQLREARLAREAIERKPKKASPHEDDEVGEKVGQFRPVR